MRTLRLIGLLVLGAVACDQGCRVWPHRGGGGGIASAPTSNPDLAGGGGAAPTFVQAATDNAGTNTSGNIVFGSNIGAGNAIIAIGGPYANAGVPTETVTGVSDTLINTFTLARGPDNDGAHTKGYAYSVFGSSAGADTVVIACSAAPAGGGCIGDAFEVSGANSVETSNASSGNNGGVAGVVTGPSVTVAGNALIVAFQFSFATSNSANNNGWTGAVTGLGDAYCWKQVTAGTYAVDCFNVTATAGNPYFIEVVALKN